MNTRAKGGRTFRKAMTYAKAAYPKAYRMPIYQVSRWSQPQPCDLILFELDSPPILVEVRTNQWGVSKPQTRTLAHLPGLVSKQIWMFPDGQTSPMIREWSEQVGTNGHWERIETLPHT